MKVCNCTENDALSLAFYLYQLCADLNDFESHEECQILYNALVNRLNLGNHADAVLNAMLYKLEKIKQLTPVEVSERYIHPFAMRGKLKTNYREDESIFENCGNWESNTHRDVNLIRALFCSNKNNFARIVALTFFTKPGCYDDKTVALPNRVPVPAKIKKALDDVSSVQFAVDTLKLSEDEAKVLQVAFRTQSIKELYAVCNDFFRNDDFTRFDMYSKCSGKSQKEIRMLLKNDQKLKAYGLIDSDGDMDEDAMDAIYEKDMRLYFTDIVKSEKSLKAYETNSFSVSEEQTDVAVQLLKSKNACNILLYGAPGAGKTEYAKALIKQAGLKMTTYKNELEVSDKDDADAKALSRLNCYLSLKKEDSVLVVDEAENVLQTREFSFFGMSLSSSQKGTVNKMLETSENKCIFIVNYTTEMDESTLRRFTYSIKFQAMPKETLRSIAAGKLKPVNMPAVLKNDILDMCGKYKITGASVDNVVKAISSLDYQKGKEDKVRKDIKSVLEANSSLLYGKTKMRDAVKKSYDLSVLNTSVSAAEIIEMLKTAELYKKENQNEENSEGVRMLFYGLSGTGKTELARYISTVLGKPLLLKRCSDLLGPYVGQTERLIAEAFEEAESTDSILLFDEADSFFADRAGAKQSWERTQVNEFLTQMEEFSGICICTTNLRKIMDPAMQRRFHIITEFKALNEDGITTLLKSFFGKYKFNDGQIQELAKFNTVTPGDFGSLKNKMRFIPQEKLNSEYVVNELLKIQDEKRMNGGGAKIGFAS
ncbi:MAG: AAA family ATPase [Treponema sp.]|nr:AAA family ATPase [Treponema sp.]MDY5838313.1 AAA family ATPase [Treponema sp.]